MNQIPTTSTTPETRATSALTYWAGLAGVYALLGMTFFKSGWEKLFEDDGTAPGPLAKQFARTFLDSFPGIDAAWVILGVLELLVVAFLVVSLIRLEFLPTRSKNWLKASLGVGLLTFAFLAMGQTTIGNHEGTASLYTYFGSTAIILLVVDRFFAPRARS